MRKPMMPAALRLLCNATLRSLHLKRGLVRNNCIANLEQDPLVGEAVFGPYRELVSRRHGKAIT